MPNIDHLNLGEWRIGEMWALYFIIQFALIYSDLQQWLDGVVVSTLAFQAGDLGSIPPWTYVQIFNFPFSPSHPSGVTKPSSLKLATSDTQRGES